MYIVAIDTPTALVTTASASDQGGPYGTAGALAVRSSRGRYRRAPALRCAAFATRRHTPACRWASPPNTRASLRDPRLGP